MSEALLRTFYEAFRRRDGAAIGPLYAPDATFSDEVFVGLRGGEIGAMWSMLCERGKDLEITFANVRADDRSGSVDWEARYTFGQTGRAVHNVIHGDFTFRDGKIATHRDTFDFWRWSRQALGAPGLLLGWTPIIRGAVRRQARAALAAYMRGKS